MKKDIVFYYIDGHNNLSFKKKSKDKAVVYAYILKFDFKIYIYIS
jgi:hypothetical protein